MKSKARMAQWLTDVLSEMDNGAAPESVLDRLCQECVPQLDITSAGVVLRIDGQLQATLGSTDSSISMLEELEFTTGEGPCIEAHARSQPVTEPDLRTTTSRWPVYSISAVDLGIEAVFAFPLHIGAARFGVLNLVRNEPGQLSTSNRASALVVAGAATTVLLAMQANGTGGGLQEAVADSDDHRVAIHQAVGMISVQLNVNMVDSQVALRARAYALNRPVSDVAADVVARRLRFDH